MIAAFYRVYNALGYGFLENVYANALTIELGKRGHRVRCEVPIRIVYEGEPVGIYRADRIVDDLVGLEIKSTEVLAPHCKRQLINYLHATKLPVGLLLHFGPKPSFVRVVNAN